MMKLLSTLFLLLFQTTVSFAQRLEKSPAFLGEKHAMQQVNTASRFLLLPIEESQDNAHISILRDNQVVKQLNCRLAVNNVDYYVPLDLADFSGKPILLDIFFNGERSRGDAIKNFACWQNINYSDTFDTANREKFRPVYHHTPVWGWMNDPNGMFYKDGVWHLYFQHNPYGSQWENMTWGHSISRDLVHWTFEGNAIVPDGLGTIFSGSCVVDKNNTAGFGKNAIVALYTTAGASQTQSLAYSTDDGKTFTKYEANPILTDEIPDFRDPNMFWNDEIGAWNLLLAAGQEMKIYSSKNLKDWKYESSFGHGYGNHDGVWECPDLMRLPVDGTNEQKWVLICNINPGGPFGGSATQYFVGNFDGHRFVCDSEPQVTKWMDYGKDHYAAVSFSNAPDGRHVALAWMSNWQYANQVPTLQFRSANSIPRDLTLFTDGAETWLASTPSPEMLGVRGAKVRNITPSCEVVMNLKTDATLTLRNARGEEVVMKYDAGAQTFSMDRTRSGQTDFSSNFTAVTVAPTHGRLTTLRLFIDRCSVEAFDADGKMAMSNLVFPSEPYNRLIVRSKNKVNTTIYSIY
ncbi:DUF4980 domain-containing protein [Prevotella sp. oral taxon 376]|uniref:DUF4980 domain-containing protein n=1 Tax=Prevotella sp. oral taxon 376 TaxID=712466 RepID=UPI00210108ED|nr:DUF4980 domain-containing protein [Prevotella sp. oral taxon 376]